MRLALVLVLTSVGAMPALAQDVPASPLPSENARCGPSKGEAGPAGDSSPSRRLEDRLACWCLADAYRNVAARSHDEQIARAARRAAAAYEQAGPSANALEALGLVAGQSVTVDLGREGVCSTVVR